MNQLDQKKRKQDLGIFYTPENVVDFIYDVLKVLKEKEDKEKKRWKSHKPPHYPSVIDPACGEGIFLKKAIQSEFTGHHPTFKVPYVFGVDLDESVVNKWAELSILSLFEGNRENMQKHFYGQNGLLNLPDHKLSYKKGEDGLFQFDAVVGNPPYGGIGIDFKGSLSEENQKLLECLEKYEIFNYRKNKKIKDEVLDQMGMFFEEHHQQKAYIEKTEIAKLAQGTQIEVLFLERFIQLAKTGGWIAVIIPDGILANSNMHYVRQFIADKTKVLGIVSLSRNTFKHVGTSAKTSILFLQKIEEKSNNDLGYPVFLASINNLEKLYFDQMVQSFNNFTTMAQSKTQKIIKDTTGNEVAMIRIDKTLKEITEEKPSSRWDVDFWKPDYDDLFSTIRKFETVLLDDHRDEIKSGFRSGGVKFTEKGYPYIQVRNVLDTGLDLFNTDNIPSDSKARQSNKRLSYGDILLNRSGQGSVGRLTVFLGKEEAYVGGHVYRFSVKDLSPVYVTVFLKTKYGKEQIHRFESGVSGQTELDLEEILHIEIPLLELNIIKNIEEEYEKMTLLHDKAMQAKKSGSEELFIQKMNEKAEKMLKDLIARTEAVIRGERENVI